MIFFSYSRTDGEAFAETLAADLRKAGMDVWMDKASIRPGDKWDVEIENALDEAQYVLFIATEKSTVSPNVMDELNHALDGNKKVIPIIAGNCRLPFRLKRLQFIDFTTDYGAALDRLLDALSSEQNNKEAPRPAVTQKASLPNGSSRGSDEAIQHPHRLKRKFWKITVPAAAAVVLLVLLFYLTPFRSFKQGSDGPLTTSVTVFVHGKGGRQDMVLRQQGHVVLDRQGGERKRADINENGAAFFQNLQVGEQVQVEVDFSEPYKSLYPDSAFVISADGRIYLPVALQGIGNVHGRVLYNDGALPGVVVETDDLKDTTDETGGYNLTIPEARQTKKYTVWFTKAGFKSKSETAYPQTGQALEVIMEKMSP